MSLATPSADATPDAPDSLQQLQARLRAFAAARDWGRFHSPKNLAAALTVEAAELLEPFQWLTEEQSRALSGAPLQAVADEMADVLLYLVQLAMALDVDLLAAARDKMARNALKYPAPATQQGGDAGTVHGA
jgi:NTP pyrophosphatase (non-canonical NTP hydrolase)